MGLYRELCFVLMGTLLFSFLLLYESRKLEGYKFPVYSTEYCPRNQTEWDERSSAINCTETNGYMCLPNEQRTELIEFCYIYPFAWVEEGVCLYLINRSSEVSGYNCVHFISGCPNSTHRSSESYIYQSCFAVESGCFTAEPSCNRYTEESMEDSINNNNISWVSFVAISLGIIFPVFVICTLGVFFYYKKANKRKSQEKRNEYSELSPFFDGNNDSAQESQRDHNVFEDWELIDSKFIQTRACKRVESLIQKKNLVIVVGHSGSGKSATIQHIALKYRSEGWAVKKAGKLKDVINAFISNSVLENQTLFVLHDPIGKESFDEQDYKSWKKLEEDLKACLKKCKFLLSCRKCVQSDERAMGLFKNRSIIVDIDAEDSKLSDDEKLKIWNKHKSDNTSVKIDLTEIIKIDAYFPLLCQLFFSDEENQKKGLQFFKEPVKVYKEEIEYYKTSSKDKFCALVLLVLFNNELCVSDLQNEGNSEQMYKLALKLCGMEDCTALSTIRGALETLHGSYVTKKGDSYQFCHDFVMEVTSYVFGMDYPKDMIEYADISFLRKRVKLYDWNGQKDQMTIYISDRYLDSLTERLLKEIVGKNIVDVVLNPCLKSKKVANAMIKNIKVQPEKIELLLTKTEISLKQQNFSQESEDLHFTKLDFAVLECNISPLCALIVFGHTDLSLYCLQTLQMLAINFKDRAVFYAVCCNGTKDMFNMFSDDINTYLRKGWGVGGILHPIHVVSLFHNYEILQILIELGVSVNQRSKYGDTALLYAIRHSTKESEDKYTNARHYKTLQLLLGNKANINLCDAFGYSPLSVACRNGHDSTVQLLLSRGANINSGDKYWERPLYIASENGHDSTVQLLLSHGADINLCDKYCESPIYIARRNGHDSTVQLLQSH